MSGQPQTGNWLDVQVLQLYSRKQQANLMQAYDK